MSSDFEITKKLQKRVIKLAKKYSFASISLDDLKKELVNVIEKHHKKKSDMPIEDYAIQRLNEFCKNQVEKILSSDKDIELISQYIEKNLSFSNQDMSDLEKLKDMLLQYHYILDINKSIKLLEYNQILAKKLEEIVTKKIDRIKSGNLEAIFEDDFMISMVESYCMIHDIDIENEKLDQDFESIKSFLTDDDKETQDIVRMYFKEIGKYPPLTREEEKAWALKKAKGDQNARKILILHNLQWVISIVKQRKYYSKGLSFLDLIQEGSIGLIEGIDKFDVEKGYRLSTYTRWWIRDRIGKAIVEQERSIRIPENKVKDLYKCKKGIQLLSQELGRTPTTEELAKKLGMSKSQINTLKQCDLDIDSLNRKIGENEEVELIDSVTDKNDIVEKDIVTNNLRKSVARLLRKVNLTKKERAILRLRCGFKDGDPWTLEEIGEKFHLTREAIRQKEAKALSRIRESKHLCGFSIYMDNPDKCDENIDYFKRQYKLNPKNRYKSLKASEQNQPNDQKKEKRVKRQRKKKQNHLIEFFEGVFTIDELIYGIELLNNDNDKTIIYKKNGTDLLGNNAKELTKEERERYNHGILKNIKKKLQKIYPEKYHEYLEAKEKDGIDESGQKLLELNKSTPKSSTNQGTAMQLSKQSSAVVGNQPNMPESDSSSSRNILQDSESKKTQGIVSLEEIEQTQKSECIKPMELIKSPAFEQMLENLDAREAMVLALKLGQCSSSQDLTELLGISEEEMTQITIKAFRAVGGEPIDHIDTDTTSFQYTKKIQGKRKKN